MRIAGERGGLYVVTILDVSKSGMRISGSVAVTSDTHAEIMCRGMRISGMVRYARNVGRDEYHMGFKADDDSDGPKSAEDELDLTLLFRRR